MTVELRLMAYGPEDYFEGTVTSFEEVQGYRSKFPCIWLDIAGDVASLDVNQLMDRFGLHRLALADLNNPHQRPKVEDFVENLFVTTRMAEPVEEGEFHIEPYYMWLLPGMLLSIQHTPNDCLERLRAKVRAGDHKVRTKAIDYLLYLMLDGVVQGYFPILEAIGDDLDEVEDAIISQPARSQIARIHHRKGELLQIRKSIWPQRELLLALSRDQLSQLTDENRPYFRDTFDHVVQVIDLTETNREICGDLADLYMGSMSNRLNDVMKVLTMISTIFIPLSFIAGIYGMNFNTEKSPWNMPELNHPFGYPLVLGGMLTVGIGLLVLFRRWGWIGPQPSEDGS